MLVTENEAMKDMICPLSLNAPTPEPGMTYCYGAKCMAWRKTGQRPDYSPGIDPPPPFLGYCGLAGTPEVE